MGIEARRKLELTLTNSTGIRALFLPPRVNLFPKVVSSLLEIDSTCRPNAINFCLGWYIFYCSVYWTSGNGE